jgi:hypothetical protein
MTCAVSWALVVSMVFLLHLTTSARSDPENRQSNMPVVFAHYMHCYVPGSFDPSDPHVRDYRSLYEPASSPPLEVESQWFSKEVAETVADGPMATRADFARMEHAGLDAAGLLVAPHHLPDSRFARALHMAAEVAETSAVKIIPELWFDAPETNFDDYGRNLAAFLRAHPGAQKLHHGKPVFLISEQVPDGGSAAAREATKDKLDRLFASWGGRDGVELIVNLGFGDKSVQRNSFAQLADVIGMWTPQDDWTSLHSRGVVHAAEAIGKDYAYPVSLGFYQRRAGQPPWEYGNSFGAARFIDAWSRILKLKPKFVEIETWNDFSEDTAIVPTNTHGSTFLHLTRYFVDQLRSGAAEIGAERAMVFHPRQIAEARLETPKATVKNYAWRHGSPIVDYVDVVTLLKEPARVRVKVGTGIWEREVPAGLHELLLISQLPKVRVRGDDVRVGADSLPQSGDPREAIRITTFEAAVPEVELERDRKVIFRVVSRAGFANHGPYQDLTVIGTEEEHL